MAKKKAVTKSSSRPANAAPAGKSVTTALDDFGGSPPILTADAMLVERTGRMIITFRDGDSGAVKSSLAKLKNRSGVAKVSHMRDFSAASFNIAATMDAEMLVFDELGIAVMAGDPEQQRSMVTAESRDEANVIIEPEYMNYGMFDDLDQDLLEKRRGDVSSAPTNLPSGVSLEFLKGYQAGVQQLVESMLGCGPAQDASPGVGATAAGFLDTVKATWGLQATRVLDSRFTGLGIKVAILDTGFDPRHPDFVGRSVTMQSFIAGETPQDLHGHGTHCIGTSCGPLRASTGPRYGIAYQAEIFAGKVLSNAGSGSDGGILAGIDWAMRNGCQIISMSLGRAVMVGEKPATSYETAGRRALAAGTLIIAAAGNESARPSTIRPVGSPANASTIVAVAAVDQNLRVASFSNGGTNPGGGEVNIAAPGVNIRSSLPIPRLYASWSGTSMATPHVAGIAALIAQESMSYRGIELYRELRRRARPLSLPPGDIGNGLAEAV